MMERTHSRPGSPGKVIRQNSYGKNFREAQTLNLQNRRSELKALFQVQQTAVHGGQEGRARPGSQSDSAQLRRKSQEGKCSEPCDRQGDSESRWRGRRGLPTGAL